MEETVPAMPPSRARGLVLGCALLLTSVLQADAGDLDREIGRILSTRGRDKARVGIEVVATDSARIVHSERPMEKFIVASNEKLVTAATALTVLGSGYRFVSSAHLDGAVENGRLRGDLVIRGGADPTIGGRYDEVDAITVFRSWAGQLQQRGIREITGDLVADDRYLDREWYHPNWAPEQAWKWYFAPVSALSTNDNCVTVTVKPGGAPGTPARLAVAPPVAPVELVNACTTSSRRHAIWFDRTAGSLQTKVGGFVRTGSAGYSHEVSVPNPPLYAALTLREVLNEEGVRVRGEARLIRPDETYGGESVILRRTELLPVLRRMVKRSHNHYAEQVLKTIGAETRGDGSWRGGLRRAADLLVELGFRRGEFELDDGSGLSSGNRLPPAVLTALLLRMRHSPHNETFRSLLAVAGQDGTLRRRLREAPYAGNVRAKTGYLSGAGALSGYATTRSGTEIAFSILVNDDHNPPGTYSMRETVDSICRAIVDHAR
ncbi:MAG: D-alanyl-D-alanine carboxypeptidase/D-alanyl-D-alanine-endopeptidase [Candidatus Brocadiaceae bacterium]